MQSLGSDHRDPERGRTEHQPIVAPVPDRDAPVRSERLNVALLVLCRVDLVKLAAEAGRERRRCAERVRCQEVQLQVLAEALERADRLGDRLAAVGQCAVDVEDQVFEVQVLTAGHGHVDGQRTTITGQWAWCATRSAVEPSR
jgi:hypothetical protein